MEGATRETQKIVKIQEMRSFMKSVNCIFIVLEIGGITVTKGDHTISHALVADNTASINLSLWDTQVCRQPSSRSRSTARGELRACLRVRLPCLCAIECAEEDVLWCARSAGAAANRRRERRFAEAPGLLAEGREVN